MHTRRADQSVQICSDPFECQLCSYQWFTRIPVYSFGRIIEHWTNPFFVSWIFFRTWKRLPVALRFRPLFLAHSLWSQLGKTGPRDHSDVKCSGRQIQQFRLSEVCIEKLKGQTSQKKGDGTKMSFNKKRFLILNWSLSSVRKCSAEAYWKVRWT